MSTGAGFCPSCGKPIIASNMKFCQYCGASLPGQQQVPPVQSTPWYQAPSQPTPTKSNTTLIIAIIVIVIVAVAVIGGILAVGFFSALSSTTTQHSGNIVNGLVTVPAGYYQYYQFTVPASATLVSVNGMFTASGGSGNDIIVYVFDSTNFVNWQNGYQASAYYNSGQTTTGTVSASLPSAGTYYLVYSNTFSTTSSKNVQTTVNLSYYG